MLTLLAITLRRYPALESFEHTTRAISRFLGPPPNLLLSEACESGSTATLDWIWAASCTTVEARTPGWSFTNYLRSDPLYYRWQFAKSLYAAAERGDLAIVEWLFTHFSGCEAPADIVSIAEQRGNLHVLRFLWERRSGRRNETTKSERLPKGTCNSSDSTVQFDSERFNPYYDGKYWGEMVIKKAVENGQLAKCLDDGMQIADYDRATATTEALRLGDLELAERLVPSDRSILHYAIDCPQLDVITRLLDEGYLQWNEFRAATVFRNLAKCGSWELMQQIFQLHSPLREDQSLWKRGWSEAIETACSNGNLCVLKWLVGHPLGSELCDKLMQTELSRQTWHAAATAAASNGHIEVMQFLYDKGIASPGQFSIHYVIEKAQLSSVKWFVHHGVIETQEEFSWAISCAAQFGCLDILQLFQTLDKAGGYEAVGLKRRRTDQTLSLWDGERDFFYWAAEGGHVAVLEWLQANYPAECKADTMDIAASRGHLDAVKWLHANRSEGCTSNALHEAADHGHFEIVKWLFANRPESRTCEVIVSAIRSEHFRIAYWLHFQFPDNEYSVDVNTKLISCWFRSKPLEALLFLRAIYPSFFTESFVKQTREDCTRADPFTSSLVLRWLEDNYSATTATEES